MTAAYTSPEPKVEKKSCVSKAEALEMVTRKQNQLSPVQAARELLMQVTGNTLEAMGRKDEKRMLLEVDNLQYLGLTGQLAELQAIHC